MVTVTQNIGEITLFQVIDVFFQSGITTNQIIRPILVQWREIGLCFLENHRKWRRRSNSLQKTGKLE
jgi:hypothetical protein